MRHLYGPGELKKLDQSGSLLRPRHAELKIRRIETPGFRKSAVLPRFSSLRRLRART